MSFRFKGMDSYENLSIHLIDTEAIPGEIELTGSSFEYDFEYMPATENNEILPSENRFYIQFTPDNPTGINALKTTVRAYCRDNTLHVVSAASDPIRQIEIYNTQGVLLYTDKHINALSYSTSIKQIRPGICILKISTEQNINQVKIRNK
jgi:hypothetical protein